MGVNIDDLAPAELPLAAGSLLEVLTPSGNRSLPVEELQSGLRGELEGGDGASIVGHRASTVADLLDRATLVVSDVSALASRLGEFAGQRIVLAGYWPGTALGGGVLVWDATTARNQHNGGTIFSPTVPWSTTPANYLGAVGEVDGAVLGVWRRRFEGPCYVDFFGARSAPSADAFKKCFEYGVANSVVVGLNPVAYTVEKQITVSGMPSVSGCGTSSSINANFAGIPFVFVCNTTTEQKCWRDFLASLNSGGAGNAGSALIRIEGNSSLFVFNRFERIDGRGLEALIEVDKDTFSTSFGNESPFAWNRLVGVNVRGGAATAKNLIRLLNGSGTGNSYLDCKCDLDAADAALIFMDGRTTDVVCGDVIVEGCNTGGTGAATIKYGTRATQYRSRILLTGNQFDSGMVNPLDQIADSAAAYTGVTMVGNNVGGLVDLYTKTQPMRNSQIHDKGIGEWLAGNYVDALPTGAGTRNVFTIQMAPNSGGLVTLTVDGFVAGVSGGALVKRYLIRRHSSNAPTLTVLETVALPAATSGFFDVTTTTAVDGTIIFTVTWTATAAGSTINAQIVVQGGHLKIKNGP